MEEKKSDGVSNRLQKLLTKYSNEEDTTEQGRKSSVTGMHDDVDNGGCTGRRLSFVESITGYEEQKERRKSSITGRRMSSTVSYENQNERKSSVTASRKSSTTCYENQSERKSSVTASRKSSTVSYENQKERRRSSICGYKEQEKSKSSSDLSSTTGSKRSSITDLSSTTALGQEECQTEGATATITSTATTDISSNGNEFPESNKDGESLSVSEIMRKYSQPENEYTSSQEASTSEIMRKYSRPENEYTSSQEAPAYEVTPDITTTSLQSEESKEDSSYTTAAESYDHTTIKTCDSTIGYLFTYLLIVICITKHFEIFTFTLKLCIKVLETFENLHNQSKIQNQESNMKNNNNN